MPSLDALVLGPCMTAWGEPVTFQPAAGPPVSLRGVWSERFTDITVTDGNAMSSTKPVLGCRATSFLGNPPQQNDVFTIRGRLWSVDDVDPDGEGHLHITLRLANEAQRGLPVVPPSP